MLFASFDGATQAFLKGRLRTKPELTLSPTDSEGIKTSPHQSVRHSHSTTKEPRKPAQSVTTTRLPAILSPFILLFQSWQSYELVFTPHLLPKFGTVHRR
jgi:hypothetical protein